MSVDAKKAEELFLAVTAYGRAAFAYYAVYLGVTAGKITMNQAFDVNRDHKGGSDAGDNLDRSLLIVSVYFPSLMEAIDRLMTARNGVADAFVRMKDTYRQTGDATEFDALLRTALSLLGNSERELRAGIISEAVKLNRQWWDRRPPRVIMPIDD